MKAKIFILILLLFCLSALYFFYTKIMPNNNPKLLFHNNTIHHLDSITIYVSKKCIYKKVYNIPPKSMFEEKFIFCDSIKGDGSYFIEIYHKEKKYNKIFGYYTNGGSLNNKIDVSLISLDSMSVKFD